MKQFKLVPEEMNDERGFRRDGHFAKGPSLSIPLESMIDAFDSNAEIIWSLENESKALARFFVPGAQIAVKFFTTGHTEWHVTVDVDSELQLGVGMGSAVRAVGGAFQAVREFLEVRQPERLVFASKEEAFGEIYEIYLTRQNTKLRQLGYRTDPTRLSIPPYFSIIKTTPSEWRS